MKVEAKKITVRDLVEGYVDDDENGVRGYAGALDIRPPYQREFIYKPAQQTAVINTVTRGFPLNSMYWAVRDDGKLEIIDGQQRTLSICSYVHGDFTFNGRFFSNLQEDEKEDILDYELDVYLCSGRTSERLEWFKVINIAGEKLTNQELLNAVYAGSWLSDARRYFSKTGCPAYEIGKSYIKGSPIRQDFLETALRWVSGGDIVSYMARHQHEPNANNLWLHFQSVIAWVKATFPNYRREMKGIDWGALHDIGKDLRLDPSAVEERVKELMADEDVTKKRGIYHYIIDGRERHLSIRQFSDKQKREAYERQGGVCPMCNGSFDYGSMHGDHRIPWHDGGRTTSENCQMLCKEDNREKGGR